MHRTNIKMNDPFKWGTLFLLFIFDDECNLMSFEFENQQSFHCSSLEGSRRRIVRCVYLIR